MDDGRRNRDTKPGARRDSRRDTEEEIRARKKRDISDMTEEEIRARKRRMAARRRRQAQVRRRKRILACCAGGGVLLVLIIAAAVHAGGPSKNGGGKTASGETLEAVTASSSEAAAAASAKIKPTDLKMTFTGDVILGTDEYFDYSTSMNAYYDLNGPDYFLKNVKDIFSKDDLTVINFEGTLTNETARVGNQFAFKAPPEYVNIINKESIEAANVANNHSHDYGEKSFTDTVNTLKENHIEPFGYDDTAVIEVKGVKVGLFGIYELDEYDGVAPQVTANINKLKKEGADVIIAVFHWGNELESCPDQYQVKLGHQAIDEGADLVVGHHPHVIQGIEYYKGKTIAYSLGNFCFGGNYHPTEIDTMIFQTTISVDENARMTGSTINIIPCLESTTWEYNDYVPTPLTGADAQSVIDKLDERSQEIASTYQTDTVYDSTDTSGGNTVSSSSVE